ncbi:hypothetical protein AAG906_035219 [Vitis piasezkii]
MAKFLKWRKGFPFWRGRVRLVVGAFEESCGVGGFGFVSMVEEIYENYKFVTKRKPLVLVVLEGVKGNGWEALRKAISSVQDLSDQAVRASKETIEDSQVSKGIYKGGRSYAYVVAEEGPRNKALLPLGKWAEL